MIFSIVKIVVLRKAITHCGNPIVAWKVLRSLQNRYEEVFGNTGFRKVVKANGRYFFVLNVPGWPSEAFNQYITSDLNGIYPRTEDPFRLQFIILGISKRCPLRCKHCYEWDRLNQPENLSLDDLKQIIRKFQNRGIGQIQLSGGEPMTRLNDIIEILTTAKTDTDFWVLTSGYNFSYENALKLKNAGLTGVSVSLDHWNPGFHNQFRSNKSVYHWVMEAAKNIRKADMLLCLSLCATKEFVSEENLWKYARLARKLGAGFIQILEPRNIGHFKGKDIRLTAMQLKILEDFFLKINSDPAFADMPTVIYSGYSQRSVGCFGAGVRFLYVDPNGSMHACPFCQKAVGNCLEEPLDQLISHLQEDGCHQFRTVSHPIRWD